MVKNPPASERDVRDPGYIPGSGRSPGREHGDPLQCSYLENPTNRGAWWAMVHEVTKSWTWLKWLSMRVLDSCFVYRATWTDRDASLTLPHSGVQTGQERQPSSLLKALPEVTRNSQQKLIIWVFVISLSVFPNVRILTCDLPKKQLEIGLSVFSLRIISHQETITQLMRRPTRPIPLSKGFKFRSYYM